VYYRQGVVRTNTTGASGNNDMTRLVCAKIFVTSMICIIPETGARNRSPKSDASAGFWYVSYMLTPVIIDFYEIIPNK